MVFLGSFREHCDVPQRFCGPVNIGNFFNRESFCDLSTSANLLIGQITFCVQTDDERDNRTDRLVILRTASLNFNRTDDYLELDYLELEFLTTRMYGHLNFITFRNSVGISRMLRIIRI